MITKINCDTSVEIDKLYVMAVLLCIIFRLAPHRGASWLYGVGGVVRRKEWAAFSYTLITDNL